jgi:hypothetical protein
MTTAVGGLRLILTVWPAHRVAVRDEGSRTMAGELSGKKKGELLSIHEGEIAALRPRTAEATAS